VGGGVCGQVSGARLCLSLVWRQWQWHGASGAVCLTIDTHHAETVSTCGAGHIDLMTLSLVHVEPDSMLPTCSCPPPCAPGYGRSYQRHMPPLQPTWRH
jgi:hypothetical protein